MEHSKKDGKHEHDMCAYCNCPGHKEVVCADKFFGKERHGGLKKSQGSAGGTRVAAATIEEVDNDVPSGSLPAPAPADERIAAMQDTLALMHKQMADQSAALAALRGAGFGNGL